MSQWVVDEEWRLHIEESRVRLRFVEEARNFLRRVEPDATEEEIRLARVVDEYGRSCSMAVPNPSREEGKVPRAKHLARERDALLLDERNEIFWRNGEERTSDAWERIQEIEEEANRAVDEAAEELAQLVETA